MTGIRWKGLDHGTKIAIGKMRTRSRTLEILTRDLYAKLEEVSRTYPDALPAGGSALMLRAEKLLGLEEKG